VPVTKQLTFTIPLAVPPSPEPLYPLVRKG
jgi:hypothetical protein